MKGIVFANSWEEYFKRFDLISFDDFYYYSEASTIGKNKKRNVQMFTLGDADDRKVFFIKKFHNTRLKDIFSAWYSFGRPTTQARLEWNNARYLLENGLDTYKPVCVGRHTRTGVEKKSFLVTEKLKSVCLIDFVKEKWNTLDRSAQERIITDIAEYVLKIHRLGISFPDLYLWHIFIYPDSLREKTRFSIIDLHRMRIKRQNSAGKMKELGKLYWSMLQDYFDDEQKDLLLTTYMRDAGFSDRPALMKIIRKSSLALDARRKLKNYYTLESTAESNRST
jgi:hypothetical protein